MNAGGISSNRGASSSPHNRYLPPPTRSAHGCGASSAVTAALTRAASRSAASRHGAAHSASQSRHVVSLAAATPGRTDRSSLFTLLSSEATPPRPIRSPPGTPAPRPASAAKCARTGRTGYARGMIPRDLCHLGPDLSSSYGGAGGAGGVGGLVAYCDDDYDANNNPDPALGPMYPIYDGNGNVVRMCRFVPSAGDWDVECRTAAAYEYGPFGEALSVTGEDLGPGGGGGGGQGQRNPFRFSTKYTDAETGRVYYGYRYYSPSMGRWVSRDPIGEGDGPNVFLSCANDPIGQFDMLGLAVIKLSNRNSRSANFAFDVVAKSYIAPVGWQRPPGPPLLPVVPPAFWVPSLLAWWGFGPTMDMTFSENPTLWMADKKYRLYSRVDYDIRCYCDNIYFSRIRGPLHDAGTEGPLSAVGEGWPRANLPSWIFADNTTIVLRHRMRGRPNFFAAVGLNVIGGFRWPIWIWHEWTAVVWCENNQAYADIEIDGSGFPSHRVWVNAAPPAQTVTQGPLSNLWISSPTDWRIVR
jgi:RHS repeat-associated protein